MAEIETLVETQQVFNVAHFLIKYKSTGEVKAKALEMIAARLLGRAIRRRKAFIFPWHVPFALSLAPSSSFLSSIPLISKARSGAWRQKHTSMS
jgi:hypothetical protein